MTGVAASVVTSSVPSRADRAVKHTRLVELLDRRDAESLVLRSHTALGWALDGARTHVSLAGDPVVAAVVTRQGIELRVFDNEADRMLDEELGDASDLVVTRVPWHDPLARAGIAELEEADVAAELRAARATLLPAELARYRGLCRGSGRARRAAASPGRPGARRRRRPPRARRCRRGRAGRATAPG